MKKKVSVGFVFAMVLVLMAVAGLAAGLLLSPRATATQIADRAMEQERGINSEMMTFFGREEEVLEDGTVKVTYTGAGSLEYPVGTYTVTVKDGKAEIAWSHDGEDTAGGYEAEAWGIDQLKQMLADCLDEKAKDAFLEKAAEIGTEHGVVEDNSPSAAVDPDTMFEEIEARKTKAMKARKISEEEMIAIGREFIISNYGLNEEQAARMELYTNFNCEPDEGSTEAQEEPDDNGWYDMINGKPCFQVEYLLYQPEVPEQEGTVAEPLPREEKDGYYLVYVNVETGEIEEYEYNSGLAGKG